MPVKDIHHDIVVRSLRKAGWTILTEQLYLSIGTASEIYQRFYIDIETRLNGDIVVLIEVKLLSNASVRELMQLLGQYLVYQLVLEYLEIDMPLYVAIPQTAYEAIKQQILGQQIMNRYSIPWMIYDPEQEKIQEWIPAP